MDWTTKPIENRQDLEAFLEVHQDYLSGDRIVEVVQRIPELLRDTLVARYLQGVVYYHLQFKKAEEERDWTGAYDGFKLLLKEVGQTSDEHPLLSFYIPDYVFLAARNAGEPEAALRTYCDDAIRGARRSPQPVRSQLRGFILFNWARTMVLTLAPRLDGEEKELLLEEAYDDFCEAVASRIRYYEAMEAGGDAEALKTAATQVWRCREDFPKLFPGRPLEDCPVSAELHAETARLADPQFRLPK